jgi:flagellar M-ring protein FliF
MATLMASTPDYEDLFTNLSPDDAAAIAAKLDDERVKYQLADNDTTVMVPSADKDRLRMEMVRDGLPTKSGSVLGTEWLDKINMGTTSDVQDQYIQLANEGELSRTISTISSVASASVHISPGDNTPFAVQTSAPSASCVIGMKPGDSLTNDQAEGIASLISKSVPGLDIKNVVVIDTNGNQLWDGGADPNGPDGTASGKIAAEQGYSEQLRKQMQSYLDTVLGPHKAIVSVSCELNYDQKKTDEVTYTKGAVLSEVDNDEKYSGGATGAPAGTPAGITANTQPGGSAPTYPTAVQSGKTGTYQNSGSTTNYDDNKTETDTDQAQGSIQRLAVAVLIDNTNNAISPTTVSSIQTYLSTLIGATATDPTRAVTVQSIPFSNVIAQSEMTAVTTEANSERQTMMLKAVAVIAFVGAILFLFFKSPGASKKTERAQSELSSYEQREYMISGDHPQDNMLSEGPVRLEDVLDQMPEPERRSTRRRAIIPEIEEHQDVKLEGIREMIRNQPQAVALLMKGWMSEDQGV